VGDAVVLLAHGSQDGVGTPGAERRLSVGMGVDGVPHTD
jgi:hypothetical protein